MFVGICRFTLLVGGSHSLKERRSVVRRVRSLVATRLGIPLTQVGDRDVLDTWQRADLAFAVVGQQRDQVDAVCHRVLRLAGSVDDAQVGAVRIEIDGYGEDWFSDATAASQALHAKLEGSDEDDAAAGAEDWLPAAWRTDDEDAGGPR